MDSTAPLKNREHRRKAAASRRAARENVTNDGGSSSRDSDNDAHRTPEKTRSLAPQPQQKPQQKSQQKPQQKPQQTHWKTPETTNLPGINLISVLSQALNTIDKHNNDFFSGGGSNSNSNNGHLTVHNDSERKKLHTKLPPPPSHFSFYLKFNRSSLHVLLTFTICYLLVLLICYPMISYSNLTEDLSTDDDLGAKHHIQRGASFRHIRGREKFLKAKHAVSSKLGTLKDRAVKWEEEAKRKARRGALEIEETEKDIIDSIAGGTVGRKGGVDAQRASMLLERAVTEFDGKRTEMEEDGFKKKQEAMAGGHDHWSDALDMWESEFKVEADGEEVGGDVAARNGHKGKLPGFMVLGMHRSGTSMLSGLLVKGFGYETGGPLIGASFDNEKGFYERIDVVLQNDEFLTAQQAGWSFSVVAYDGEKALQHKQQGKITFKEGESALKFLNNRVNALPYLQKDPRMCIALPTWLKLLDETPAIVFTYRHPLEVAMSLKHREQNFSIEQGLRLWIIYNMRAIQNSEGLCRVFSTNEAVFQDTLNEVQRIKNELTEKCHVIAPPNFKISEEVVNKFVDPNLQHNSKERKAKDARRRVLKDFGGGCVAHEFESNHPEKSPDRMAEVEMFLMAMQVFCDFENGKGYSPDYEWPDLAHWKRPTRIN